MAEPIPAYVQTALDHLADAVHQAVPGSPLAKLSWREVGRAMTRLLGGPYQPHRAEHRLLADGLAGLLGEHLGTSHGAFWFPHREAPGGFAMGFPDALLVVSPFEWVHQVLPSSGLETLADRERALAEALKGAGAKADGAVTFTSAAYLRLFDPGFVQFVALDLGAARKAWSSPPDASLAHLEEALRRAAEMAPDLREQLSASWIEPLRGLAPGVPLGSQAAQAPRLVEAVGHLFGTVAASDVAPEELWADIAFPLLFIGAASTIPASAAAAESLEARLATLPRAHRPPAEGLLGAFSLDQVASPDPVFDEVAFPRLYRLGERDIRKALDAFVPEETRRLVMRLAGAEAGGPVPERGQRDAMELLEQAVSLLTSLQQTAVAARAPGRCLALRRLTGAEVAAEGMLLRLRGILS